MWPALPSDFGASGLLDDDDDDIEVPRRSVQPPGGRPEAIAQRDRREVARDLRMRSRSRDEPPARTAARRPEQQTEVGRSGFGDRGSDSSHKGKGGGKGKDGAGEEAQGPKEEPNFEASGLLGLEDNSKNGVALKFTAPAEARYPTMKWRLYIFTKQAEEPKVIHIHRMVGVLFGKDRRVVDVPTDHPTCSKQHAVLHYRLAASGEVKPYIMDLESTNGTFLNGSRLDPARYYEMRERDMLKFGMSSREFVLLHAGSASHMAIDPSKLRSPSN